MISHKVYKMNTTNSLKSTHILKGIILLLSFCFIYSCDDNEIESVTKEVPVVSLQDPYRTLPNYLFTVSTTTLKKIYTDNGIADPDVFIKNPVSYHRLVYTTTYNGQQISASGAMIIPIHPASIPPIVSFQHGTMFADRDAPSNITLPENITPIFNEYIVFMPDYIGYGESKDILHPYFLFDPSVRQVIDMIKAGKQYLDGNHIQYDHKLFLTGHSEGGYVTVATQKELENNPIDDLNLTASAPSAGPYDVELIGNLILQNNIYPSPAYLLLIFSAYNEHYWHRPITDFFQSPYSSKVSNLLNGNYNEDEINDRVTTDLTKLMNPIFLNDFRNDGEVAFKDSLKSNSVYNWMPKTPTHLYHGTADQLVPFKVSQETYKSFISNDSDTSVVKLVTLQGIGHNYIPAYKLILEWFKTFN